MKLAFIQRISLLFTLLLLCFHPRLYSQTSFNIDSLLTAAGSEKNPVTKISIYFSIANHYRHDNADSALLFNKLALKDALILKDDSTIAQAYYNIAALEATRNNYNTALSNCDSAFKYYQRSKDTHALAMVRNVQGGVYMVSGRNEMAADMYFDAIRLTEDDTASNRILFTYHNLVILLNTLQRHPLALQYAMKQYAWAKRIKQNDEIAYACSNIADTYQELDSPLAARRYILELKSISSGTNDPYVKVIAKNQIGNLYYYENKFLVAVNNYRESLKLNDNLVDQQLACNTLNALGKAYQKLGLFYKSDSCFNKAIEISSSIDVKEERKDAYENMVTNALLQNDFKNAFHFLQLFVNLSDSLLNEKNQQALIYAESKYESEKNKKQIELLNAQSRVQIAATEKQRLIKNIIIASAVLLFIIAALFFNRYQLKKKIESQQTLLNERKRISRDLHDDVGSTLSSVRAYSEILRDNPNNPVITELLKDNATEMMERLEIIAWATNPQHDTFGNFIDKINRYAIPISKAKNINYALFSDSVPREVIMPGEIRQNLYLVAKEAINNTIKYADASNCSIKTEASKGKFTIEISDDGKGFNSERDDPGNGLKNMQSRVKEIGGELTIITALNKGTKIKAALSYPFKIPDLWDRKRKLS